MTAHLGTQVASGCNRFLDFFFVSDCPHIVAREEIWKYSGKTGGGKIFRLSLQAIRHHLQALYNIILFVHPPAPISLSRGEYGIHLVVNVTRLKWLYIILFRSPPTLYTKSLSLYTSYDTARSKPAIGM
jgi:hypothetical protein